jgi:hypothetical protein
VESQGLGWIADRDSGPRRRSDDETTNDRNGRNCGPAEKPGPDGTCGKSRQGSDVTMRYTGRGSSAGSTQVACNPALGPCQPSVLINPGPCDPGGCGGHSEFLYGTTRDPFDRSPVINPSPPD